MKFAIIYLVCLLSVLSHGNAGVAVSHAGEILKVISEADTSPLSSTNSELPNVLVLGSGGLLGRALVKQLKGRGGVNILEVLNRRQVDLRDGEAVRSAFGNIRIDFIYFLACEVGGAKFIESSNNSIQLAILRHNVQMYENVFRLAAERDVPMVFTSSYMRHMQHGAYAAVKRLGEEWVQQLPRAKTVRLWNLYGHEDIGVKSHVIADWVADCVMNGVIAARTDAQERRQFMHVDDASAAMVAVFSHFQEIPDKEVDISSNTWIRLVDVAAQINEIVVRRGLPYCPLRAATVAAPHRAEISPVTTTLLHQRWDSWVTGGGTSSGSCHETLQSSAANLYGLVSLEEGISRLVAEYITATNTSKAVLPHSV